MRGDACPQDLLDRALAVNEGREFLSVVIERLGDLFEPRLCRLYDELFSRVIAEVHPELSPRVRPFAGSADPPSAAARVYVLSRITLGADIAVTSVLLDAAKQRFPEAQILFVGPRKNYELFEADPRIGHYPAPYARSGALADRLRASQSLWFEDGLVIDPDSRLSQLGLVRICPDEKYFFFPSREFGSDTDLPLPALAARWARKTFGVAAKPFILPLPASDAPAEITVSLGVGENDAKRVPGDFERDLMRLLARTGASVLVDKGGDAAERARVESVLQPGIRTHDGAFAPFAAQIARGKLFIGYDSAAGHAASACGVPLISIARGFVSPRMQARWRPNGTVLSGPHALGAVEKALHIYSPPFTSST
jgi:ADP-heptose:LPS heptosyltransferase